MFFICINYVLYHCIIFSLIPPPSFFSAWFTAPDHSLPLWAPVLASYPAYPLHCCSPIHSVHCKENYFLNPLLTKTPPGLKTFGDFLMAPSYFSSLIVHQSSPSTPAPASTPQDYRGLLSVPPKSLCPSDTCQCHSLCQKCPSHPFTPQDFPWSLLAAKMHSLCICQRGEILLPALKAPVHHAYNHNVRNYHVQLAFLKCDFVPVFTVVSPRCLK